MAKSLAIGVARRVDRAILTATLAFSGGALIGLVVLAFASRASQGTSASLIYGVCLVLCSLFFLMIGGVAYTVGAIIYARDIGRWTAAIWHGCVLTGSLTHFIAVILLLTASGV